MHLLEIGDLTSNQVTAIFKLADQASVRKAEKWLNGKLFLLFFPESSLRTRIAFERGIKDLGGECLLFPPETLDKRESLHDVAQYVQNWADGLIIRHPDDGKVKQLAAHSAIPIINAMTSDNHPCEILSDLYAIQKRKGDVRELVFTFVGPAGNICKSWAKAAQVMDLRFNHVCIRGQEVAAESRNYNYYTELEEALPNSDVVLTDALPELFRTNEYIDKYQITMEKMNLANKQAILNPCPPFFRGEEVSADAIASDFFVGYSFKMNLLFVQQAILLYSLQQKEDAAIFNGVNNI
ncbi:ornithine carbamoyltransferase [Paenibacillus cymbidii]|uniref:ornithine carbamoyltransferase n=1 Tax=Paenibacillus cymbidii TaxID=1639034 RepID=UPI001082047A|nr:ornithine carbamoyltransferase [Paenibacillus cymbidii]